MSEGAHGRRNAKAAAEGNLIAPPYVREDGTLADRYEAGGYSVELRWHATPQEGLFELRKWSRRDSMEAWTCATVPYMTQREGVAAGRAIEEAAARRRR